MASKTRSVRASAEEWAAWQEAADTLQINLNTWIRRVMDTESDAALAEKRRAEDRQAERQRLVGAMRGNHS